jgi:hypothetical protein
MSEGFRPRTGGGAVATFSGFEADLLRSLASQLVELLRNERAVPATETDPLEAMLDFSGPTEEPEDPVLARLFPTAYPDDPESAGDFRRFTESALRDGTADAAITVIDVLEDAGLPPELTEEGLVFDVELDEPTAETWLRSFTDIRLALATRLEVEEGDEEYWETLPDDDPRGQAHDIYLWMGYLQETLVDALSH